MSVLPARRQPAVALSVRGRRAGGAVRHLPSRRHAWRARGPSPPGTLRRDRLGLRRAKGPAPSRCGPAACPPAAVRLDLRYEGGDIVQEIFYDDAGRPILSDGRPWPPRPSRRPRGRRIRRGGRRAGRAGAPRSQRLWSAAGVLEKEASSRTASGAPSARSTPTAAGGIVRVFAGRHAPRALPAAVPAERPEPLRRSAIREERGTFERGQAVGTWTFARGRRRRAPPTVARGLAFDPGGERPRRRSRRGAEHDGRRLAGARARVARGGARAGGALRGGARGGA